MPTGHRAHHSPFRVLIPTLVLAILLVACSGTPGVDPDGLADDVMARSDGRQPSRSGPNTTLPPITPTTRPDPVSPAPIYGLTVEDIDTTALVDAVRAFSRRPTIRVVFQAGDPPSHYRPALLALRPYADIVGLLYDSTALSDARLSDVVARTDAYLGALGGLVDIWEIGNEINGEWVDEGYPNRADARPAATTAKVDAMFDRVTAAGGRTAITGMYLPDCTEWAENEMFGWLNRNISSRVRARVDFAWISYYEDNCTGAVFSQSHWQGVFDQLATLFPSSRLGFGEIGYSKAKWSGPGNTRSSRYSTDTAKISMMHRYHSLRITTPNYVGGYFWWYAYQDVVPHTGNVLWAGLNDAFEAQAAALLPPGP